nr:MAG TPA: hypothetical protein [Caudoviricetes sp.]
MADTDNTSETPSTTQVDGVSVPSQITINIGGGSAAPDLRLGTLDRGPGERLRGPRRDCPHGGLD